MDLTDSDFDSLRAFLVDLHLVTPPGHSWEVRRLDGRRYHGDQVGLDPEFVAGSALWRTGSGRIIAAVHPEGLGEAHFQIHPDFRALEREMIDHAWKHLAREVEGRRTLVTDACAYDAPRRRNLAAGGFTLVGDAGVFRQMRLGRQVIPQPTMAAPYRLRTTRFADPDDCGRIAHLLNAAFGRDFHRGVDLETFHRNAPSFRTDLDLVAEAPDGSVAAYVGIAVDTANAFAVFEPVCTHPDHRRHGLAAALMYDGLHRLRARGYRAVCVGTGTQEAANKLYESIGFTEAYALEQWRREEG